MIAEIPGDSANTLLIYDHYDVQPADPLDEWTSDPFGAEIRDGRLYARGSQDTKGNIIARLAAVEAWLRGLCGAKGRAFSGSRVNGASVRRSAMIGPAQWTVKNERRGA